MMLSGEERMFFIVCSIWRVKKQNKGDIHYVQAIFYFFSHSSKYAVSICERMQEQFL
jgi:hypothetical protein